MLAGSGLGDFSQFPFLSRISAVGVVLGPLPPPVFLTALLSCPFLCFLEVPHTCLACSALPERVLTLWNTLSTAGLPGAPRDIWISCQSPNGCGLWFPRGLEPSASIFQSVKWVQSLFFQNVWKEG